MSLSLVTAPTWEPVSLVEAIAHLRIDGTADNDVLTGLITATREYAETFTHRAIPASLWDLKLDGFPGDAIAIPKPPLQILPTPPVITYLDTAGVSQTWSATLYTIDAPSGPKARGAYIVPNYGQVFPATRDVVNAVTVRFWAGYADAASVPGLIKTCQKELIRAHELRGDAEDARKILEWVHTQLWGFKAF